MVVAGQAGLVTGKSRDVRPRGGRMDRAAANTTPDRLSLVQMVITLTSLVLPWL